MQLLKKTISLILSACVLFSATGLQGSIYYCKQIGHNKHVVFFDNTNKKDDCCSHKKDNIDEAVKHNANPSTAEDDKCCLSQNDSIYIDECEENTDFSSENSCCSSQEQTHSKNTPFHNELISPTKCCTQSTFYYQLEVKTLVDQYKYEIANSIDFVFVEINLYTVGLKFCKAPFYISSHAFLGYTLKNGKRLPVLFSQFII